MRHYLHAEIPAEFDANPRAKMKNNKQTKNKDIGEKANKKQKKKNKKKKKKQTRGRRRRRKKKKKHGDKQQRPKRATMEWKCNYVQL